MSDFLRKPYKTEPVTVRISFNKLEKIDKLAEEFKLSRSKFINQCIDYAIEHMPSDP